MRLITKRNASNESNLSNKILKDQQVSGEIRTGDILLWSNTSIDSMAIQELTDGPYSHSGLVHKDEQNRIWILDTYPEKGLRHILLEDYLTPKEFKLVNVGLIRLKGALNVPLLETHIQKLLENQHRIVFDNNLIFDGASFDLNQLSRPSYAIYCSELIYVLLRNSSSATLLYENDYDRIMKKWDILKSKPKGKRPSALDFIKLYYLKLNLKKLRDDKDKILITPNGILRSGAYNVIKEIEVSKDLEDIKRLLRISEETEDNSKPK